MTTNKINFINFDHPELWVVCPGIWDEMKCFIKECKRTMEGDAISYCRGYTAALRFNMFYASDKMIHFKELHGHRVADILIMIDQIESIEYEGRSLNARGYNASEYRIILKNGIEIGIHL